LALQFLWVPLLLAGWGAPGYGQWLLYGALAGFLQLADLGFSAVCATELCGQVARKRYSEALEIFEACFFYTFFSALSAVVLAAYFLPTAAFVFLALHSFLSVKTGQLHDVYRGEGQLALGTLWNNSLRLLEGSLVGVLAWGGVGLGGAALAQASLRLVAFFAMQWDLRRRYPWFRPRFHGRGFFVLRRGVYPSLAYLLFPLGEQVNANAVSIVVGSTLGPAALGGFSTLRTLVNTCAQPAGFIRNSALAELTALNPDPPLAKRLFHAVCWVSFFLTLGFAAFLVAVGPFFYGYWTHGKFSWDGKLFAILLCGVFLSSLWQVWSLPDFATNRHTALAVARAILSLVFLGAAVAGMQAYGPLAAAVGLALTEAALVALVGFQRLFNEKPYSSATA
jgi:O-antigen/teichoic acid export membrane protein